MDAIYDLYHLIDRKSMHNVYFKFISIEMEDFVGLVRMLHIFPTVLL